MAPSFLRGAARSGGVAKRGKRNDRGRRIRREAGAGLGEGKCAGRKLELSREEKKGPHARSTVLAKGGFDQKGN